MSRSMIDGIPERHRTLARVMTEQAQRLGDKPYIVFMHDPGNPITFASLAANAEAAAGRLRRDHRLEAGTVGCVLLPNGFDFVSAWSTSQFAALVDVPINYEFKKTLLRYALATVGARLVFTDQEGFERLLDDEVRGYLAELLLVVLCGPHDRDDAQARLRSAGSQANVVAMAELQQPGPAARAWEQVPSDALTSIRYTSGTTGHAKGIMYTHLHLLNRSATHNTVMTLGGDDVLYTPFPLYHGLAGSMGAVGTLQAGATLLGARRFSATRYWADAHQHGATLGHILFTMLPMLLSQPPSESDTAHRVRYLYSAWPHREFETRFKTSLLQIFAQSEVGVIAYQRGGTVEGSRSVGKPQPDMEIQIVGELDHPLPVGNTGQIVIRPKKPHTMMQGYYNNLPATLRAFSNMWHHTGDSGYFDADGNLYFLGRLGNTIRRRGVNISSDQIDEEIIRHPGILECATIGVPSELGEEDIHSCIVWREPPADQDAAVEALIAFMAERMPRQHVPRYLELVENLPKTDTGKIKKSAVQARLVPGKTWDRDRSAWL